METYHLTEEVFILVFCRTIVLHIVHVDISTKDTYERMYQKPVAVHHEVFCPLVHMPLSPLCFPWFESRLDHTTPHHTTPDAQYGLTFDPNIRLRQKLGQKWTIHIHLTHVEDS
jgi:hypothetical protein